MCVESSLVWLGLKLFWSSHRVLSDLGNITNNITDVVFLSNLQPFSLKYLFLLQLLFICLGEPESRYR